MSFTRVKLLLLQEKSYEPIEVLQRITKTQLVHTICTLVYILTVSVQYSWAQSPSSTLADLIDQDWEFRLQEDPLLATTVGVDTYDALLPEATVAAERRRARYFKKELQQLLALDRSELSETEQINYDFLHFILENDTAQAYYQSYLVPMDAEGGFHTNFAIVLQQMPLATEDDIKNYLARLQAYGSYTDQYLGMMEEGITQNMVSPQLVATNAQATITPYLTDSVDDHPLYQPLKKLPSAFSASERQRWQQLGREAIATVVVPAMQRLQTFMTDRYVPRAPEAIGANARPQGQAWYEQRVRYYTTLPLTPDEVFARGEQEVARLQKAMQSIIDSLEFEGTFSEFLGFLRTDPQFYATSPEALLQEAAWIAKRVDGQLPKLFERLPRLPYGVAPVPKAIAPTYTSGRYVPGSATNQRAGTYWVNTFQLKNRPRYALPALTLHEAVPGHHLQIALAQEMEGVPPFRQHTYLSAYGEGWGLYAESLGDELGVYQDLYQKFGQLTSEMWRACRLVVDVGMHARGWTRQQAVDYMADRTALSEHEVNTEIDRYIGWPGQALSYKIGELKIQELRHRAEEALGKAFDIRRFHSVVLENGSIPLFVLEEQVNDYMDKVRGRSKQ